MSGNRHRFIDRENSVSQDLPDMTAVGSKAPRLLLSLNVNRCKTKAEPKCRKHRLLPQAAMHRIHRKFISNTTSIF
jgi:hypothetical protein